MQRRTKLARSLATLAIVGLVFAGISACGHHPWHQGNRSEFILKHLDSRMSKLDLNDTQKAAYQQLRGQLETDLKRMDAERKENVTRIKAELSATSPDMKKVAGFVKEGIKKHPEVFEKNLDRFTEFYGQLNATQQKEIREFMLKHIERFDG